MLVLGCEPLDDAPILDLRIRKGVRRSGVKLAIASARPSALDPNATLSVRFAPGDEAGFLSALEAALRARLQRARGRAPQRRPERVAALAELLRTGGEDVVILWGESLPAARSSRCCGSPSRSNSRAVKARACSRSRPEPTAAGFARPARCRTPAPATARSGAPAAAPRRSPRRPPTARSPRCTCSRSTRVRELPGRAQWEVALHRAALVIAHASVLTEGLAEHATVVFPAESSAEKEGTVAHPDGRVQRSARAIAPPRRRPRRLVGDRRDREPTGSTSAC